MRKALNKMSKTLFIKNYVIFMNALFVVKKRCHNKNTDIIFLPTQEKFEILSVHPISELWVFIYLHLKQSYVVELFCSQQR